jgi:hypothetical protein
MSETTTKLDNGYNLDSLFEPGRYAVTDPTGAGSLPPGDYFIEVNSASLKGIRRVNQQAVDAISGASISRIQTNAGWGTFVSSGGGGGGTAALTTYANANLGFGLANNVESALDFALLHGLPTPNWLPLVSVELGEKRRFTIAGVNVELRATIARTTTGTFDAAEAAFWTLSLQESFGVWAPLAITIPGFIYLVNNVQYSSLVAGLTGLNLGTDVAGSRLKVSTKDTFSQLLVNAYYPARFTVQNTFMGSTVYLQKKVNGFMASTIDATAGSLGLFQYVGQDKPAAFLATTLVPEGLLLLDNKILYRSKTNHVTLGTLPLDISDWDQLTGDEGLTIVAPWSATTVYATNQLATLTISGITVYIKRVAAGTSATTFTVAECANWAYVTQSADITVFPVGVVLPTGVKYQTNGVVYVSNVDHLTLGSFVLDIASFNFFMSPTAISFVGGGYYPVGMLASILVGLDTVFIRRNVAGVANATYDALENAKWDYIGQNKVSSNFPVAVVVPVGYKIKQNGYTFSRITTALTLATLALDFASWNCDQRHNSSVATSSFYQVNMQATLSMGLATVDLNRTIQGVSSATVDAAELANWEYVGQRSYGTFVPLGLYIQNFEIIDNGSIWRRLTTGVALTTWTLDAANWQEVASLNSRFQPWSASTAVKSTELRWIAIGGATLYMTSSSARTTQAAFDLIEGNQWVINYQSTFPTVYPTGIILPAGYRIRINGYTYRLNTSILLGVDLAADISNWTLESSFPGLFVPSVFYPVGAEVYQNISGAATRLIRNAAGNSLTTLALDGSFWNLAFQGVMGTFTASTWIPAGFEILEKSAIYKRITQGTTLATFALDAANWKKVADAIDRIDPWIASSLVEANEVRSTTLQGVTVYLVSIASATTLATFDATEALNWRLLSQPRDATFTATSPVVADMRFMVNGVQYRRTTSGVTLSTFTLDAANFAIGLGDFLTDTVTQVAHGFVFGQALNRTLLGTWIAADISDVNKTADVIVNSVIDANTFKYTTQGTLTFLAADVDAVTASASDRFAAGQFKVGEYYHFNNAGKWTVLSGTVYSQAIAKALTATTARILLTKPEALSTLTAIPTIVTSGTTYTIPNQTPRVYFNPAAVLPALAVTLPPTPTDGDAVRFIFGGTILSNIPVITALTVLPSAGQTIYQSLSLTSANGGDVAQYTYQAAFTRWVRDF